MQFLYNKNASDEYIQLDGLDFNYIFKVRRAKADILFFRNMLNKTLYEYELIEKTKKIAKYKLKTSKKDKEKKKTFHLAISIIDIKEIEKLIPFLNELEVAKISFVYAKYSQRNIKINLERINKILINSSQQCGRNDFIEIDEFNNVKDFLSKYPNSYALHFNNTPFKEKAENIETILVGAEGGFSDEEISLFDDDKIVGINTDSILRTTTACAYLSSFKL